MDNDSARRKISLLTFIDPNYRLFRFPEHPGWFPAYTLLNIYFITTHAEAWTPWPELHHISHGAIPPQHLAIKRSGEGHLNNNARQRGVHRRSGAVCPARKFGKPFGGYHRPHPGGSGGDSATECISAAPVCTSLHD